MMAMFGKDGKPTETRLPGQDGILSILASGMRLVGDLEGPGLIKIDGQIEGSISGSRQVIVGRDGTVRGNVQANEVILAGSVEGSVTATDRVEVQASATVNGDVTAKTLIVHDGARLNGNVRMTSTKSADSADRPAVQVVR